MEDPPEITVFNEATDSEGVVELWIKVFGYETAHNDPHLVIQRKARAGDLLFFVAKSKTGKITGSIPGF